MVIEEGIGGALACVCCRRGKKGVDGWSHNIYKEMAVKDLKKEYVRIKNDKYRFKGKILKGEYPNSLQVKTYIEGLEKKQRQIKEILNKCLRESKVSKVQNTLDAFD